MYFVNTELPPGSSCTRTPTWKQMDEMRLSIRTVPSPRSSGWATLTCSNAGCRPWSFRKAPATGDRVVYAPTVSLARRPTTGSRRTRRSATRSATRSKTVDPYWGFGLFRYIRSERRAILKGLLVVVGVPRRSSARCCRTPRRSACRSAWRWHPWRPEPGWIQLVGNAVGPDRRDSRRGRHGRHRRAGKIGAYRRSRAWSACTTRRATATTTWTANTTNRTGVIVVPGG